MRVGVWVGLIVLLGVDAETGVFMLLYLDLACQEARREGRLRSLADLHAAILQGAARRIRPKFMTLAPCTTNPGSRFLPRRFFSCRLGDQLVDGGVTRREDRVEDQAAVFGDLITMRMGKFLNQPMSAQ
jgi:hypothetical protein